MLFSIKSFIKDIYQKRALIIELVKRDFKQQYMGSYLGFVWVFLQPLMFIGVMYTVFTLGFRSGSSSDEVPFVLYLITGMIAWTFFAKNFNDGSNILKQFSFLIKRMNFRLIILPIVKILSAMIPHTFFICIAIGLSWYNDFPPTLYTLQIFYYLFASTMLLLGLGWLTSSTNIFVKDVSKLVGIIVQFGFWLTPIFWNISRVPQEYQWIIQLNPAYYLVSGYRDSLLYHRWFWERPYDTLYFWGLTTVILFLGIIVFKRLRPHFAEVI